MFESSLDIERVFGKDRAMARTRVRWRRLAGLACVTVMALGVASGGAEALGPAEAQPVPRVEYVVRSGDSLWKIAVRIGRGHDPRPLMEAIGDANGIEGGALVPGQLLRIPAVA